MSLIRASFWITLSELAFNLSGYITHAILGRILGPADYGRYGLIITLSTMIVVLISRGVPIAMSKYLGETGGKKERLKDILLIRKVSWRVQLIVIAIVTLIYYLLAPVFAYVLRDQTLLPLLRLSALIIPAFSLATFYVYYFIGIQEFNKQAFLKFFRGIGKMILIIGATLLFSVPGAIIGHALAPFSVFLVAYFLDPYRLSHPRQSAFNQHKSAPPDSALFNWKKLMAFAWPITFFMLFYEIMITIDLYLVKGILRDDNLTGLYNAALNVGRLPYYAFYFLTLILLPKISEATAKGAKQETKKILRQAMRFLFILLIPSIALMSAFSFSIIEFFYGSKFYRAGESLEIISLGMGFYTVFYILAFVLNGAGKNKIPMWSALLGALLNAFLSFILIGKFGILGAAWATTLSALIIMLIVFFATQKKIAPFIRGTTLLRYLFYSMIIYSFASLLFPQGKYSFIFSSLVLLIIYFAFLYQAKEINREDWLIFKKAITSKKKK